MLNLALFFQVTLTLHQRDQQLEALQQEHLDLLKQLTTAQETLQAKEQSLNGLQVHCDELQARLEELQGEAASRDEAICFLQNEKIVLEVALQAAKSGREEFDTGAKSLEEGSEGTSETLEQLSQELAIKSNQVTWFAAICYESESYMQENADCMVLSLNTLFCKRRRMPPEQGPGLAGGMFPVLHWQLRV